MLRSAPVNVTTSHLPPHPLLTSRERINNLSRLRRPRDLVLFILAQECAVLHDNDALRSLGGDGVLTAVREAPFRLGCQANCHTVCVCAARLLRSCLGRVHSTMRHARTGEKYSIKIRMKAGRGSVKHCNTEVGLRRRDGWILDTGWRMIDNDDRYSGPWRRV